MSAVVFLLVGALVGVLAAAFLLMLALLLSAKMAGAREGASATTLENPTRTSDSVHSRKEGDSK